MLQANQPLNYSESKHWKTAFIVLSAIILILMPLLSKDYGQSGDEWLQIEYGKHIWDYFTNGDQQALNYDNRSLQYQGQEFYGGLYDYGTEILHHWFPSIPQLYLRHFINALMGAIMMIFTGLLAKRVSKKWSIGLLALLFIFFSPRIFGESMNNPKDIPFACGFIVGIYSLVAFLQDYPNKVWKHAVGIALGFGVAFGVRSAGGILLLAYMGMFTVVYYLLNKDFQTLLAADKHKHFKRAFLLLAGAVLVGYIIGLLAWPWGLQDPISNPIKSLHEMTNRTVKLRVLFEGQYRANSAMPWYYEFKWMFMTNPIIVLLGLVLFVILAFKALRKYGTFATSLLLFCGFFPLLYMAYKHSSVHDTWRHVFFVYTIWVVMSALAFDMLRDFIKNSKYTYAPVYVAMIGLLPTVIWTVRSHPNQYVYFNELQGGPKGAWGYYDLDYYQNSGKQAAKWILANAKPIPGRKVIVLSNMMGFDKYFANDTSWITFDYGRYNNRHALNWDYYVAYPRYIPVAQLQNDKWPPQNVVHRIEIDGLPLSVVFQNKSKAGIAASEALQKGDFATAIQKYQEYLQTDSSDENVWSNYGMALIQTNQLEPAIAAFNKAAELDPSNPDYFKILYQLYTAKGDMQNAQQALIRNQTILMELQEAEE